MHTIHHRDLQTLLEVARPASLLLIDPDPSLLTLTQANLSKQRQLVYLDGDIVQQLHGLERFDLGIVANTLEHLDHKNAGRLLAMLRDLHTSRFVALLPMGNAWENQRSHWDMADLLGYGMTLMAHYKVAGRPLHLYHYAIESYKTRPDWFNSQHWAHPERWKP
jgi:hypothetical protein